MPRSHLRRWMAAFVVGVLGLTSCAAVTGPHTETAAVATTRPRRTTTTSSTTTSTTTTTVPPTTTALPLGTTTPPPGLGQGASGPQVLALEQRLAELRYDVGKVDGSFDSTTGHAVMAFQKVEGMERTSRATDDVVARLASAALPGAMLADGGPNRVEIDLKRQVLLLFQNGQLVRTLSVSTGNNKRYCVDGECAKAVTPGGSFKVGRKIKGLRVSRLGKLYNPLYFNGGIAIHGSPSVPAGPASHGCVRIPMSASAWFHDTVPVGTPVYVIGGARAPVPFNEQAPTDVPGDPALTPPATLPATTTTTTVPPAVLPPVLPLPGSATPTTVAPPPADTTPTTGPYGPPPTVPPPSP